MARVSGAVQPGGALRPTCRGLVRAARQQGVEGVPVLAPDSRLQTAGFEVEPAANPVAVPSPDRSEQPRRRGTGLPQPLAALRCSVGAGRRPPTQDAHPGVSEGPAVAAATARAQLYERG